MFCSEDQWLVGWLVEFYVVSATKARETYTTMKRLTQSFIPSSQAFLSHEL